MKDEKIFELIKTEEGRKEIKKVAEEKIPEIIEKRKREGFYSTEEDNIDLSKYEELIKRE